MPAAAPVAVPKAEPIPAEIPVSGSLIFAFIGALARKDANQAFAFLRRLQISGRPIDRFMTAVVQELAAVYYFRIGENMECDKDILRLFDGWETKALERILMKLLNAIDGSFESPFVGSKLAVMETKSLAV